MTTNHELISRIHGAPGCLLAGSQSSVICGYRWR